MRKANLIATETGYKDATHVNKEGHPSFSRDLEERFVQCLLTNMLENTFYVEKRELAKDAIQLHSEMLAKDPEFYAKALVYARNEGYMRLQPTIGLTFLSTAENKMHFHRAFPSVIRTPNDLKSFVEFCKTSGIRHGLGRAPKTAINRWLNKMSEYHAIKYGTDSGQYSMYNILRLTRPRPISNKQKNVFGYLTGGEWSGRSLRQVSKFERLKKVNDPKKQRELIETGKLPHEVVTGVIKPDEETWSYIMRQMPYFALLRNLNTLDRHNVLDNQDNIDYVVDRLTNEEAVKRSKILPFRFYSAHLMFEGNQEVQDALVTAMEMSFENMPELKGHVVIANDISGSMSCRISDRGQTRYCDIAGIFGAALLKKCEKVTLLPFHGKVVKVSVSKHDSIMTTAEKLSQCTNGTDIGTPIKYMNDHNIKADVFIGITDNEEWMSSYGGYYNNSKGFLPEWKDYKSKNPNTKAFLITISPYQDYVAPQNEENIYFIYGWNDNVLNMIATTLEGIETQIEHINAIKLE